MNGVTSQTGLMGGAAPEGAVDEYRIRELEARLERRVEALEGRVARARLTARLAVAGLVATLGALAFVAGAAPRSDDAWTVQRLSTRELALTDADGVQRGVLATDAEGQARLALSDRDGRERIRLTVLGDGSPGVTISDRDARPRAVLGYLPDGTTNLVFADAGGVSRAVVGVEADGSAQALFTDAAGSIRTLVGVGIDGAPAVSVFEEDAQGDGGRRP